MEIRGQECDGSVAVREGRILSGFGNADYKGSFPGKLQVLREPLKILFKASIMFFERKRRAKFVIKL